LDLKKNEAGATKVFYVPELDKTDAAIVSLGHHVCHDGITQMQVFHVASDDAGRGPYPFMKRPTPSIL
jgi:hypothetical protein